MVKSINDYEYSEIRKKINKCKYKSWEGFFGRFQNGIVDFKEKLVGNERIVNRSLDELISFFQENKIVSSREDAQNLTLVLNDVRVDYGEGVLIFTERKEKLKNGERKYYEIQAVSWKIFNSEFY